MKSFLNSLSTRRAGREAPPLIAISTKDLGYRIAKSPLSSVPATPARNSIDDKMGQTGNFKGLGILDSGKDWDDVKDVDWAEKQPYKAA